MIMNKNKKENIIKDIMNCCDATWNPNGALEYMELVESMLFNSYDDKLKENEMEEIYFEIEKRL